MSALDLLSPRNKVGIGGQAGAVERTFGEIYSLSAYTAFLNTPVSGQFAEVGSVLNSRNKMIEERTGKKISELTGTNLKYTNPTMEGRVNQAKEDNELLETIIAQGRKEKPELWSDIKTKQEIEDDAAKKVAFAEQETAYVKAGNPNVISRETAAFLGMAAGTMLDAPNVATLPISAPSAFVKTAGYGVAKTVLMNAAAEGVVQAGIQAAQIPDMKRWQETLGKEYGLSEAAFDVGAAFAGGAILRGAGEALGFGFRKALKQPDVTPSSYVLSEMARFVDPKRQVEKDALLYLSRSAYIDENAPFKVSNNTELAAHRDTVQKIVNDVEDYKRPAVEDVRVRERVAAENPVVRDVVDDGVVDVSNPVNKPTDPFEAEAVNLIQRLKEEVQFNINNPSDVKKAIGYTPKSLSQFIRTTGGIADTGGDLKSMGVTGKSLPGLVRKTKDTTTASMFGGSTAAERNAQIDYAKERAFDAGYFPEKSNYNEITNDEFLQAITNDIDGKKVYSSDDLERIAIAREGSDFVDQYDRVGITQNMSVKEIAARLKEIQQPPPPLDFDTNAYSAKEYRETPLAPPEQIKQSERMESMKSSFDEMLEADPDMMIDIDANTRMKLSDYAKMVQEDEDILNAITTCRLQ